MYFGITVYTKTKSKCIKYIDLDLDINVVKLLYFGALRNDVICTQSALLTMITLARMEYIHVRNVLILP